MTLSHLISDYCALLDDKHIIEELQSGSFDNVAITQSVEKLVQHNAGYISRLEKYFCDNIPDTPFVFETLTSSEIRSWFEFWVTHLHFCEGREEKLIRLFSEMVDVDFEKWKTYQDSIKTICMCESMSYFATMALPCQADIVEALLFVVDKCATRGEADVFYNEINVAKMLA